MKFQLDNENCSNKNWMTDSSLPKRSRVEHPSVLVETIYTMPNWVTEDIAFRQKWSKSQISQMYQVLQENQSKCEDLFLKLQPISGEVTFRLIGKVLPKIVPIDAQSGKPLSNPDLKRILLKRKYKARWRRELMLAVSEMMLLQTIESQSNFNENHRSKFLKIIDDPVAAEKEVLEIWNKFVDECEVPSSFLVSTRSPLSLHELIMIRSGSSPENRQKFVNKIPWVARSVLNSNKRDKHNRKIDANLENFDKIASKYICCMNRNYCLPAQKLATKLTLNQNPAIGQLDNILDDPIYREILVCAHEADNEIITHIGKNAGLAKRQIGWASEVYDSYKRYVAENSRFAPLNLSALLARVMIRNEYELDSRFCPETIVKGFLAVSLDSFAVFTAKYFGGMQDGENAFHIDLGVAAFVYLIGMKNPSLLTMPQLIEFANKASQNYQQQTLDQFLGSNWPAPKAWNSSIRDRLNGIGAETNVIIDKQSLYRAQYGELFHMNDFYASVVLGESVIFAIGAADGQATLTLQPVFDDNKTTILDWKQSRIDGCQGDEPSSTCKFAATEILQHFRTQCPDKLSKEEIERKDRIQTILEYKKYKTSEDEARSSWKEVYTKNLPRIFSETDPKSIVAEYYSNVQSRSDNIQTRLWRLGGLLFSSERPELLSKVVFESKAIVHPSYIRGPTFRNVSKLVRKLKIRR